MRRHLRIQRRRRDERGATFVLTAVAMIALLWGGAMGVDLGFSVVGSRTAQGIADTGALDMTRYINIADGFSKSGTPNFNSYMAGKLSNILTDNDLNGSTTSLTETAGSWTSAGGFNTSDGPCYRQLPNRLVPCNAVKVTVTQTVPQIFLGGTNSVSRSAIAYLSPEDAFSIGTYVANLNSQQGTVLNGILSTLGTSASLTAVGYEGLANTYITVGQLITASAGLLTTSNVLTTSLTAAQWLSIFKTAAYNQELLLNCGATPEPSACVAYTNLGLLTFSNNTSTSAELCQLVSINGTTCAGGNVSEADLSGSLDLLQTLTAEGELVNGTNAIDLGTTLGLAGVTDAKLTLQLVQPPQVAYGPVGASATSAQVTQSLQLTVTGIGTLTVPLSAAEGTATLSSITCLQSNNSFQAAALNASTTAATGSVTLNDPTIGFSGPVATASASGVSTSIGFTDLNVPPTASTFGAGSNANPDQIGSTSPTVTITTLGGLGAAVSTVLSTAPVSTLIGTVQSALGGIDQAAGITMAGADIADLSVGCDGVALVQ